MSQRTLRSKTTKDRAGALAPAVYSNQPSCAKVIFHEKLTRPSVTENQEEIEQNMPPVADYDHNVTGVTLADDSEVAVVAVCEMSDIPVQEDEYDTDSESDREVWSSHPRSFSP